MAPKGARARSQSAGRGSWDAHLLEAVVLQLANSFQLGSGTISGGMGRRGDGFQGKGRPPLLAGQYRKQVENPEDWQCEYGYIVWTKRPHCPKCTAARVDGECPSPQVSPGKPTAAKEQEATAGGQRTQPPQEVGTEGDAKEVTKA
eukprot:9835064-Heterocapsa_arctica.AAC.1